MESASAVLQRPGNFIGFLPFAVGGRASVSRPVATQEKLFSLVPTIHQCGRRIDLGKAFLNVSSHEKSPGARVT
jgi:hypothetical protein